MSPDSKSQASEDKKALLRNAFELYKENPDELSRKDAIKELRERVPGFTDRQYESAWTRVRSLFDNACRLVFRWASINPAGTVFELPDSQRIFLDELGKLCRGFSEEEYSDALEYGFEKSIF